MLGMGEDLVSKNLRTVAEYMRCVQSARSRATVTTDWQNGFDIPGWTFTKSRQSREALNQFRPLSAIPFMGIA